MADIASLTVGDLERQKFELNADDQPMTRVGGATKDSTGKELSAYLEEHFTRQTDLLNEMNQNLIKILNHQRQITEITGDYCDDY